LPNITDCLIFFPVLGNLIEMTEYSISNEYLDVVINKSGAEVKHVLNKVGMDYIWRGNPLVWGRHAPTLFPYVGKLEGDTLRESTTESHPEFTQHGFARDMDFLRVEQTDTSIILELDSASLQSSYPYSFKLFVSYRLEYRSLNIEFKVQNTGSDPMYFSIGYHPALRIPFFDSSDYSEYYLEFELPETSSLLRLEEGLIGRDESFLNYNQTIALNRELFSDDALIFEGLRSDYIKLKHILKGDVLRVSKLSSWPYLGIWSKPSPHADFVCIEPWCGIADYKGEKRLFKDKRGIIKTQPRQIWNNEIGIEFIGEN